MNRLSREFHELAFKYLMISFISKQFAPRVKHFGKIPASYLKRYVPMIEIKYTSVFYEYHFRKENPIKNNYLKAISNWGGGGAACSIALSSDAGVGRRSSLLGGGWHCLFACFSSADKIQVAGALVSLQVRTHDTSGMDVPPAARRLHCSSSVYHQGHHQTSLSHHDSFLFQTGAISKTCTGHYVPSLQLEYNYCHFDSCAC